MSRPIVTTALAAALAWGGPSFARDTRPTTPATTGPRSGHPSATSELQVVTVTELNRPPEKCALVETWKLPGGTPVMKVRSLSSGELMTVVGPEAAAPTKDKF